MPINWQDFSLLESTEKDTYRQPMYHMANAVVQRIHCIVIYSSFQNGSYKGLEKRDSIVITSRNYQRKDGIIEEQQKHNQFLALTLLSVVRQQFSIVLLQHSLDS